jgi:ketosteroid isomerase-like protein
MTRMHRGALILAVGLALAAAVQAAPNPTTPSDQEAVVRAIRTFYEAASKDDLALFHTVAADFYAFDGGKRFDGDALMELIRSLHAAGNSYVWTVTEPEVHLFGETALITYVNRGSIRDPSGEKARTWLESALLRKDHGTWRIVFFHSTRVP